jgi:heat shock protein HtpX
VRTATLLAVLAVVVLVVGSRFGTLGSWIAVAVVAGLVVYAIFYSHAAALRAMRAYRVSEAQEPRLHRVVRDVSSRMHVPMPAVYVSPTAAATAFAVGNSPARAAVCCTEGLLVLLDDRELRAVVAHEIAHVKNRDTLLAASVAAVAGAVTLLAGLSLLAGEDDDGSGLIGSALSLVLGPIAAGVVLAAVSRNREFAADAAAARAIGDPLDLGGALRKINTSTQTLVLPAERGIAAARHLMITNAVQRRGPSRLFATHPPIADRVARLEQMAGYRR